MKLPLSCHLLIFATWGTVLVGCSESNVSRVFGLQRDYPDEYSVTARAPLSMPTDNTLLPPRPGVPRPQELSFRQQALMMLAPDYVASRSYKSDGGKMGQSLIDEMEKHPPHNDTGIRDSHTSFVDRLMFWRGRRGDLVVDGKAEAQRLQKNSALGQSALDGPTLAVPGGESY